MEYGHLLEVLNLRVYYFTSSGVYKAVDGIEFKIDKGAFFGLVGESGSGKSTTALSILRLVPPPGKITSGRIVFEGHDIMGLKESELTKIRGDKISLVFQGAMSALDPLFKIRDQIAEAIVTHDHLGETEVADRVDSLLELVGINVSRSGSYPYEFSGGMRQRVMIGMALACNPELVIADEPTSSLDVMTAAKIIEELKTLQSRIRMSVMLITHDISSALQVCDTIAIMYAGKIVESCDAESILDRAMHPYTVGLIGAFPPLYGAKKRLSPVAGNPPTLIDPPSGCRFHPRCPYVMPICSKEEPSLSDMGKGHSVACFLHGGSQGDGNIKGSVMGDK